MQITAQHLALNPRRFGALRAFLAVVLSVVLFLGTSFALIYRALADQLSQNIVDISALEDPTTDTTKPLPPDVFEGRSLNILISGIDSRYNQGVNAHGYPEEFTTIFSDSTMVMHISADRSRVSVVSIPRDLMMELPSCINAYGEETPEEWAQFNAAFRNGAVTDSIPHGIQCTKKAVEKLSGLTIDAFLVVDFTGFIGLVDALGGVHYNVEERMEDVNAQAFLDPGCQVLNGQQALAYARARYTVGDGSDLSRIGRQQKLVAAMFREALSKNFLTDFPSLLSFIQKGIAAVKTSPNLGNLDNDIALLMSLSSIDTRNIQFITLPNLPWTEDMNRVVPDEERAEEVWLALREDRPFPENSEVTTGQGTKAITTGETGQSGLIPVEDTTPGSQTSDPDQGSTTTDAETAESPSQQPAPAPEPEVCGPNS